MNSRCIKIEPLVEFPEIEVVPMDTEFDATDNRLVGEEVLALEEVDNPQFYATILMKEEQSEEFYEEPSSRLDHNISLLSERVKNRGDDISVEISSLKRSFRCPLCSKEYARKDHLNYHMKIHAGFKDFKCDVCNKEFRQRVHLRNHKKVHTGEREFKCQVCGKDFVLKHHLTTHNSKIHTCNMQHVVGGPKRYFKCQICTKEFVRKDHFLYHTKIHTGLRDFKCTICSKEFRQKTHLKNHMKLHTGERDFKCDLCGKEFSLKHHLTTHNLRIHACSVKQVNGQDNRDLPTCRICNQEFITKRHLNGHMKVHSNSIELK
ncbi:gastrula zinc finger protein XlCGF8.2DB-like isoform X1 [Neodiprion fabricii]|uniref:gastrula zinc finger protein XlCGF8.2DB-like isoform X1 n=1 Tax=Neodiprion fabricii TaxID=2872261 RepID=UPI001ED934E1|nr:gastrula zinc finger protein XlCGF8.2DB-like isoform X1 [Neodiprion fabricii]